MDKKSLKEEEQIYLKQICWAREVYLQSTVHTEGDTNKSNRCMKITFEARNTITVLKRREKIGQPNEEKVRLDTNDQEMTFRASSLLKLLLKL